MAAHKDNASGSGLTSKDLRKQTKSLGGFDNKYSIGRLTGSPPEEREYTPGFDIYGERSGGKFLKHFNEMNIADDKLVQKDRSI